MSDKYQFRHMMIRVNDLDESVDFYTKILGMEVQRKKEFPDGKFTLVFVGYGDEDNNTVIELTYNWDQEEKYNVGDGFGHIALGVEDIYGICDEMKKAGANVVREPGPMLHGKTHIAFVEDPNGYKIELIDMSTRNA